MEVKLLEDKKRNLSPEKEKEWRIKRKSIWIQAGDENTRFFHRYENKRKNINSIYKIDKGNDNWATNYT
jgi:hypothetical protein